MICQENLNIIAVGGVDSVTGAQNTIQKAIFDADLNNSIYLNPITTILTNIEEENRKDVLEELTGQSSFASDVFQVDFYNECQESNDSKSCEILETAMNITTLQNTALSAISESGTSISDVEIIESFSNSIQESMTNLRRPFDFEDITVIEEIMNNSIDIAKVKDSSIEIDSEKKN